jgi:hypothetical protein
MSDTVLKCHSSISSITINGNVKTPDGAGLITVDSADASALFRGNNASMPMGANPISLYSPPTSPTA